MNKKINFSCRGDTGLVNQSSSSYYLFSGQFRPIGRLMMMDWRCQSPFSLLFEIVQVTRHSSPDSLTSLLFQHAFISSQRKTFVSKIDLLRTRKTIIQKFSLRSPTIHQLLFLSSSIDWLRIEERNCSNNNVCQRSTFADRRSNRRLSCPARTNDWQVSLPSTRLIKFSFSCDRNQINNENCVPGEQQQQQRRRQEISPLLSFSSNSPVN